VRRYTIAAVGKIAPESARERAKAILCSVAHGHDPANQKSTERGIPTVSELADRFMAEHIKPKRKGRTAEFYRDILDRIVKPSVGTAKADKLARSRGIGLYGAAFSMTGRAYIPASVNRRTDLKDDDALLTTGGPHDQVIFPSWATVSVR
jgi:hypothetical protein